MSTCLLCMGWLIYALPGECRDVMLEYMKCIKANKNDNGACRHLSKAYLQCRMDKGLMEQDNMDNLGFNGVGDDSSPREPHHKGAKPPGSNAALHRAGRPESQTPPSLGTRGSPESAEQQGGKEPHHPGAKPAGANAAILRADQKNQSQKAQASFAGDSHGQHGHTSPTTSNTSYAGASSGQGGAGRLV
ncbi:hypothetical protein BCV70DRAFT_200635 [Testicularia cyperi]|uniref:CHCH domain-containing protein n=1 Tax=Testicularia cyperi TaxID=1882483 RepID=A0A317XQY6_9BASI|nr:hypothetical protein BCV70DRAFT_200635 [Testicularia cyperi]